MEVLFGFSFMYTLGEIVGMALLLLIPVSLGALIGARPPLRDNMEELRTVILVTVVATLFASYMGRYIPGAVASAVVICLLGASMAFRCDTRSAIRIWLAVAVGMGVGRGDLMLPIVATVLMVPILRLPWKSHQRREEPGAGAGESGTEP